MPKMKIRDIHTLKSSNFILTTVSDVQGYGAAQWMSGNNDYCDDDGSENEINCARIKDKDILRILETTTTDHTDTLKGVNANVYECSKCGREYEEVNGSYEFCPHCGRPIKEEKRG